MTWRVTWSNCAGLFSHRDISNVHTETCHSSSKHNLLLRTLNLERLNIIWKRWNGLLQDSFGSSQVAYPYNPATIRMRKVLHREAPRQQDQPQLNAELLASGLAMRGKQTVFRFMSSDRQATTGNWKNKLEFKIQFCNYLHCSRVPIAQESCVLKGSYPVGK